LATQTVSTLTLVKNIYIHLQTMLDLVRGRKRLTEVEARWYMLQLLDCTRYLHSHNIIHRDLKLGNLFLSEDMEIKVGDFGLATQLTHPDERKKTICGTPNYIAPEILDSKDGHSFEVDTWALGVILYTMLIGKPPFETTDVKSTYKKIRENSYVFPEHAPITDVARNLISSILRTSPRERPSLEMIASHEWFTGAGMYIPRSLAASALKSQPRWTTNDIRASGPYVREMLEKPLGALLVRGSSRSSCAPAGRTAGPAARPMVPTRLEPVADVTVEQTRSSYGTTRSPTRRSIDGDHASMDDEVGSNSVGGASTSSSASSLRSLRMAMAATTTSSVSSTANAWRSHAAAAAGEDKENAAPAYSGMHAGTAAAKRAIISTTAPTASVGGSLDEAEMDECSGDVDGRSCDSVSKPDSASTSSWGRGGFERKMAHHAPNSTIESGAGHSFDLADGHTRGLSTAPSTFAPLNRASSAPTLPRTEFDFRNVAAAAVADAASCKVPVKASVVPAARPLRKALSTLLAPDTSSEVSSSRTQVLPPALPLVTPTSMAPAVSSVGGAGSMVTDADMGFRPSHASARMCVETDVAMTGPAKRVPVPTADPAFGRTVDATRARGAAPFVLASPGGLNETLSTLHTNLATPQQTTKPSLSYMSDDDVVMKGVNTMRSLVGMPVPLPAAVRPRSWVSTWVDYTSKYGLGYLLTNGNIGVYFNDSTKIVLSAASHSGGFSNPFGGSSLATALTAAGASPEQAAAGTAFEYIDRPGSGKMPPSLATEGFPVHVTPDGLHRMAASLKQYPTTLEKKVKLLTYFKKFLADQYSKRVEHSRTLMTDAMENRTTVSVLADQKAMAAAAAAGCSIAENGLPVANQTAEIFSSNGTAANGGVPLAAGPEEQASFLAGTGADDLVFVKKYVRTRRALLFRLSNRSFQASFYDGQTVLVHEEGRYVTFADAAGMRTSYDVASLLLAANAIDVGSIPASTSAAETSKIMDCARRLRYTRDVIAQLATASRTGEGGRDADM
jgi:serine/threonine protein kinase